MRGMEALRSFRPNCRHHRIGRIASRASFLMEDAPNRPAELRTAFGIVSVNFFMACYLMPLAKAGSIFRENLAYPHSPRQRYRLLAKGRRMVR